MTKPLKHALPCAICHRPLENIAGGHGNNINQPNGGSEFLTQGHYGSCVTDHMDGSAYIINVCDTCMKDLLKKKLSLHIDFHSGKILKA